MKLSLIENWRASWKLWSVRLNAIGLAVMGWVFIDPSVALWLLNSMPFEVKRMLPQHLVIGLSALIYGLAILSRLVRQPKLEKRDAKPE